MAARLSILARKFVDGVRVGASETVNIYSRDPSNIGDMYCAPSRYFRLGRKSLNLDIRTAASVSNKKIIFGGGGLLCHQTRMDAIIRRSRPRKIAAWGLGTNTHGRASAEAFPALIESFDLIGIRDFGFSGRCWVPCVSAMHSAFDAPTPPSREIVVYEHKDFPLGISGFPKCTNHGSSSLEKVIAFLSSGETVVTNSYHGVYWATLLNRNVVCVEPFSSKFFRFKHPPILGAVEDWRACLRRARNYPEALEECRRANTAFAERVSEELEIEVTPAQAPDERLTLVSRRRLSKATPSMCSEET